MIPKLIAIAGPLEGRTFSLSDRDFLIGRDPLSQIPLSDLRVSRRHCKIAVESGAFKLCDLDSSNGTLVNEIPIRERLLADHDRITIGDSIFLFLVSEPETSPADAQVAIDEGQIYARTTFIIEQGEAVYLQPEKINSLPPSENLSRDLTSLLKISRAISQIRRLSELQRQLLKLIFEVIPAEFGAIILNKDRFPQAEAIIWLSRQAVLPATPRVSRTVIDRVMQKGVALLSNDVGENVSLRRAASLFASHVESLLCVPLLIFDQTLGVIYLDSRTLDLQFEARHLELLTAIAGITAIAFDNVRSLEALETENRRLQEQMNSEHGLVGESEAMKSVHQVIQRVVPADSTVLILGENGTGKELAAQAIHNLGPRAQKPFVAINCAGLSETLLDSDLFGHEKGAFTGAVSQKKGKLEIADGGTVFLDEIGELPMQLQAKLLRVLQTREFERVGATKPIKVNIRILAATNRNLEEMIQNGQFRQDLFYRLNVVSLTMPPLRDRRDDIPLLSHFFTIKHGQKCKRQVKGISPAARSILTNYDWPGNVRELENTIERAIVFGSTDTILPEDLPETLLESYLPVNVPLGKYHSATKEAKKQLILQALEHANGNYSQAAQLLGIHPNNLHRLIRNLGLKPLIKGGVSKPDFGQS